MPLHKTDPVIWDFRSQGQKRLLALYLLVIACLYGVAGQWDYQTEREAECASKHMLWEPEQDICIARPEYNPNQEKASHHATSRTN